MIDLISKLGRFPKSLTAVATFLLTGTGFVASPQLSKFITATHSHEPRQVDYRECVPPITTILPAPSE